MAHVYEVALIDACGEKFITRDRLRFLDALTLGKLWGARVPRSGVKLSDDGLAVVLVCRDNRFSAIRITPRKIPDA